jgi:hypothetical protein
MSPNIKLEELNDSLFTIQAVNSNIIDISYMDYKTNNYTYTAQTYITPGTICLEFIKKTFKLDTRLNININKYSQYSQVDYHEHFIKIINSEIQKSFIKEISKLGEENRNENLDIIDRLDINIKLLKNKYDDITTSKQIYSKFISVGSVIAQKGRIGPANFLISNAKTYNYILSHLIGINHVYDNKILQIGSSGFHIHNSVDDGIILVGRKNKIDTIGTHCLILADDDGYIKFDELGNMHYCIASLGDNTKSQYISLNSRTLSYYRKEKLKKLNSLNGL